MTIKEISTIIDREFAPDLMMLGIDYEIYRSLRAKLATEIYVKQTTITKGE